MSNLAKTAIKSLADDLWRAEITRSPMPPITDSHPDLTVEDAYAIQTYNIDRRVAAAGVLRGRRLGMTSSASRALYGVLEPNFGALMADMFLDDGDEIGFDTLLQPRIEAEFAFIRSVTLIFAQLLE